MVNMEVAVAKCIGIPTIRVNIGTIRTPPPMPSNPEAMPLRKLKSAPSSIFRQEPNNSASGLTVCPPALDVEERFSLKEIGSIDIGRATKIIMKNPKRRPSIFEGITVVKYTPRIPPGAVTMARSKPVL